ncbi:hypothetical protein G7Y89_g3761 [Cudoniella acicularis]|uniref:SAP domain-containing protein n=1 Tax=Cudoniella acicularis TaxID=354080 RepID=A0A8H4W831_9HELO|nr:hypothetical protein G7Y89_g3761 [Cudoniella acicularis]
MPRAKRPLEEVDPNPSRSVPKPKHSKNHPAEGPGRRSSRRINRDENEQALQIQTEASTAERPSKRVSRGGCDERNEEKLNKQTKITPVGENGGPSSEGGYEKRNEMELREMLRNRGLRDTGFKDDLVKRLQTHDEEVEKRVERHKSRQETVTEDTINYHTKDNSKLQTLLRDRRLPQDGTREEMIKRLERVPANYDNLTAEEITHMLIARGLKMTALGSKDIKIKRLKLNDEMDRNTGNSAESVLYGQLFAYEWMTTHAPKDLEDAKSSQKYANWHADRLLKLLKERKLVCKGSKEQQIKRLRDDDLKRVSKKCKEVTTKYVSFKAELEERVGHPIDCKVSDHEDNLHRSKDYALQEAAKAQKGKAKFPTCEYDWKDSRWAPKTERELGDMCHRMGMEGWGANKAAYIKWLETGSIEYEDHSLGSLEELCSKRGIKKKSTDKKTVLIRLLREADESEAA